MGPKARIVKMYSGISDRSEVVRMIARLFSSDGGPGSGNHDHAGRPGKVGGSAKSKGLAQNRPKSVSNYTEPRESGKHLANKLRDMAENAESGYGPGTIEDIAYGLYGAASEKYKNDEQKIRDMVRHFADVVEYNGDPSEGKRKEWMGGKYPSEFYRHREPLSKEERLDRLKELGFSDSEREKLLDQLLQFTGGDYKDCDQEVLEDFIARSPEIYDKGLYRGIHLNEQEYKKLMDDLSKGVVSFGRISSWSEQGRKAIDFCTDDKYNVPNGERAVLFHVPKGYSKNAVSISEFSDYKEYESITGAKTEWSVVDVEEVNWGGSIGTLTIVTMIERG